MKSKINFCIAIAFVCLAMGLSALAWSIENDTSVFTLDNGLKVIVRETHAAPVAAVQVWYRVGSRNETADRRGMAHLFEHLMFRGSANYGPDEHARRIGEVGGRSNAFTSFDMTVYHEVVPSARLDLALELEADRMCGLALSEDSLKTEREVVKQEYRLYLDNNPFAKIVGQALKALYQDHPYGLTPLGRMADLDKATLDDCRTFYEQYYAPNNAVLVVVGDVSAANVRELCERHFAGLPAHAIPEGPDLSLPVVEDTRYIKLKTDIPVPATAVTFRMPGASDPDAVPLQAFINILSEGESSCLSRALTRDSDVALMSMGYPQIMQGPGVFAYAAAHLPSISSRRVQHAIQKEIDRLRGGSVTEQELGKALKQLRTARTFNGYSAEQVAQGLGFAEVVEGDYALYDQQRAQLERLGPADIQRVGDKYFSEENMTVFKIRPSKPNLLVWVYAAFKSVF